LELGVMGSYGNSSYSAEPDDFDPKWVRTRSEETPREETPVPTFIDELSHVINKHTMENGSDTPDFILAGFLADVLISWNHAVKRRDVWRSNEL
jgi:hypothetical protein